MGSIALRGVSKTYAGGALAAVNRVDLDIPDGEFVVFVGPSGCGKSTLLRMIAGLENITSGEIAINGTVVNEVAARNRDIAMVFQNYALYPQMTVRENISFALELRNLGKSEIDERVKEAARILDLRDLLNRKPSQLSGGQRQRVAMGRAIVRHPQAFLLDEPLSNLDAKLRVQLRAELVRLHARLGVTTIHVTHDQVEAMTLGSRVAVFSRGTLQQYDTPHQLYSHPANVFVAGFIGSPAMNFFEATLGPDGNAEIGSTLVQLGKAVSGTPGRKVILGVRPEHLSWRMPGSSPAPALAGKVDLIERLEPESFIAASLSDPALRLRLADEFTPGATADPDSAALVARTVTIRAPADRLPLPGAAIDITIEPGRAHLFDAVTGAAL